MIGWALVFFTIGLFAPMWFPAVWEHPWESAWAVVFFGTLILMGGN